jgi:parallel beta-helix repeat protein
MLTGFITASAVDVSRMKTTTLGRTLYVDDNYDYTTPDYGDINFSAIQDAIDASESGDTIYVYSGTYYENLHIYRKSIILEGENKDTTTIDDSENYHHNGAAISICESNGVEISDFHIISGDSSAINAYDSDNMKIENNVIQGNADLTYQRGIYFTDECNYNVLQDNVFTNNRYSIDIRSDCSGNTISNNTIRESNRGGIYSDSDSTITNNIISVEQGISLSGPRNNIAGNDISNCNIGIYIDGNANIVSDNTISNNDGGIIIIDQCGGNKIYHNNFINNTKHVKLGIYPHKNEFNTEYLSNGGNYWSGFSSVDGAHGLDQKGSGSDGIYDEPYTMNSENIDNYPWVNPNGDGLDPRSKSSKYSPCPTDNCPPEPDCDRLYNIMQWLSSGVKVMFLWPILRPIMRILWDIYERNCL